MSPTEKSQWSLHACDPVAGVETENSAPRAGSGVPLGSELDSLYNEFKSCSNELRSGSMSSWSITGAS